MSRDRLPLARPASELLGDLRADIRRLQYEREHYHELLPGCRLQSPEAYEDHIRLRLALLQVLDATRQPVQETP